MSPWTNCPWTCCRCLRRCFRRYRCPHRQKQLGFLPSQPPMPNVPGTMLPWTTCWLWCCKCPRRCYDRWPETLQRKRPHYPPTLPPNPSVLVIAIQWTRFQWTCCRYPQCCSVCHLQCRLLRTTPDFPRRSLRARIVLTKGSRWTRAQCWYCRCQPHCLAAGLASSASEKNLIAHDGRPNGVACLRQSCSGPQRRPVSRIQTAGD